MLWKQYTFQDGHIEIVRGYDACELSHMILKHGKVVDITIIKEQEVYMRNFQKLKVAELDEQAEILKEFLLWYMSKEPAKSEKDIIHLAKTLLNKKENNND